MEGTFDGSMLVVQAALLLGVGLVGHGVARWFGVRAILGAVLAGVLLSPTVLGVLSEGTYRVVFTANTIEERAWEADARASEAARAELVEAGGGFESIEEFDDAASERGAELQEAAAASAVAFYQRQALWLMLPLCIGGLTVLNLSRPAPVFRGASFAAAGQVALGAVLVPALLGLFAGRLCIGLGWVEVSGADESIWLLGWMIGGMVVSWPLDGDVLKRLRGGVGAPGEELKFCAYANQLLMLMVLVGGVMWSRDTRGAPVVGPVDLALVTVASLLFLVLVMRWMLVYWRGVRGDEDGGGLGWTRVMAEAWLFAAAGSRVDLLGGGMGGGEFHLAVAFLAWLACEDGKAIGMVISARWLGGYSSWEAMRMGTGYAVGGAGPLAVVLLLREMGMIDNTLFSALVVASVTSALAAGTTLKSIDVMEEEWENMVDDEEM